MRTPWTACILLCSCCIFSSVVGKDDALESEEMWRFTADGNIMATAALDRLHVYFGTFSESAIEPESSVYCIDQTRGEEVWSHRLPDWMQAAPVVTETRLYIGCNDTKLYCLDKFTGSELWHFDTAGKIDSTPCVSVQGHVYFGSRDGFLYALNADGNLRWSEFLSGPVASSPIFDEFAGRLYVADMANTIHAFDLDGERLWSYKPRLANIDGLRLRIFSSPALDNEQFLYVGSGDHHIYAINKETGTLFWRIDAGSIVDASPVISLDDFLYVANRQGVLFKVLIEPFAEERIVWQSESVGQVFYGSPSIDAQQNIYLCGAPRLESPEETPKTQLSYIDHETGEILWSTLLDGYTDATPVVDAEGNVYVGTASNELYKIRGAGHVLADTPWPTFHGTPSGHGRYEQTFSRWLEDFGIPVEFANLERDSDKDGFVDFEEFVQGTIPSSNLSVPDRSPRIVEAEDVSLKIVYELQKALRAKVVVEESSDLLGWAPFLLTPNDSQYEDAESFFRVSTTVPQAANGRQRWYRVRWLR